VARGVTQAGSAVQQAIEPSAAAPGSWMQLAGNGEI